MKDDMEHIEIGEVPINSDNIVSDCENPLVSPNLKEKNLEENTIIHMGAIAALIVRGVGGGGN